MQYCVVSPVLITEKNLSFKKLYILFSIKKKLVDYRVKILRLKINA